MATQNDIKKVREIDQGIESAKRFEDSVLRSGEFTEQEQARILSVGDQELAQILISKGYRDTEGLVKARQDYSIYKNAEALSLSQDKTEGSKKGIGAVSAAASLLGLGMIPFTREKGLTPETTESSSRDYAEKTAAQWNKTKDPSKARSYLHAYEMAQQDYFDQLAYHNPKRAKQLANSKTQRFVDGAITRNKLLKKEGVKEFVPRTWTPNYEESAKNRLRMIDKLSEMKAKQLSGGDPGKAIPYHIALDRTREKLLRNFADDDPVAFQHHINSQREQGKSLDPVMERVISEKIKDEQRLAERNRLSQKKHEQKDQTTPKTPAQPAKKPGRIARTKTRIKNRASNSKLGQHLQKSRLGKLGSRLNGLKGMGSKATQRIKNLLNPLKLITNLLKRSLIGAAIGAFTSFLSAVVSTVIAIASTIAAIIGIIIAKITLAITALLALSIGTIATLVGSIALISIGVFIFLTLFSVLREIFPNPAPGILFTIDGPERVKNGELIHNRIGFFYFSNAKCDINGITLVDTLPEQSTLVKEQTTGKFDNISKPGTLRWRISDNTPALQSPEVKQYVFDVYHRPQDNITATSIISLEGIDNCKAPEFFGCEYDPNILTCREDAPPSSFICNGVDTIETDRVPKVEDYLYEEAIFDLRDKLKISDTNFGDPRCSITKEKLSNLIAEKDPDNKDKWIKITECISSGSMGPNLYPERAGTAGEDESGWGFFGMKRKTDTYFDQTERDNPERGDVTWQQQVKNAVAYNNANGGNFDFPGWQECLNE